MLIAMLARKKDLCSSAVNVWVVKTLLASRGLFSLEKYIQGVEASGPSASREEGNEAPYPWEIRDCSFDWERCRVVKQPELYLLGQPEFYLLKDFESDKRKDLFWAEQYKTVIKLSVKHLPCPPAICKNWGKPYDPEKWKNTANHCLLFSRRETETAPHSVVTHLRLWIAFYVWHSGKRKAQERAGRREGCRKHVAEEKTWKRERMLMKNVFGQEPVIQKELDHLLSHLIASSKGSKLA